MILCLALDFGDGDVGFLLAVVLPITIDIGRVSLWGVFTFEDMDVF